MSGTDDFLRAGLAFGQVWQWNRKAICFLVRPVNHRLGKEWWVLRLDESIYVPRVQVAHFEEFDGWERLP